MEKNDRYAVKLPAEGEIEIVECTGRIYDWLVEQCECEYIETIRVIGEKNLVMVGDEESKLVSDPVINKAATILYGAYMYGDCVCGNVIILKETAGGNFKLLSLEQAEKLADRVRKIMENGNAASMIDYLEATGQLTTEPRMTFIAF